MQAATPPTTGTRLRCEVCGAKAIVITAHEPDLLCCGQPLVATVPPTSSDGSKPR